MHSPDHDPRTGELIDIETQAADGTQRYPSVTTLTDLINMLNDGQFNYDCAEDLKRLAEEMESQGCDSDQQVKGQIVLKIDVVRKPEAAGGFFLFTPDLQVKLPKSKNRATLGFVTGDNRFTPNKPNQGNLFGTIRQVDTGPRNVRN